MTHDIAKGYKASKDFAVMRSNDGIGGPSSCTMVCSFAAIFGTMTDLLIGSLRSLNRSSTGLLAGSARRVNMTGRPLYLNHLISSLDRCIALLSMRRQILEGLIVFCLMSLVIS